MADINPDLVKERKMGTFNPDNVTLMLYGKEAMALRRKVYKDVAEDPEFAKSVMFPTMPRDDVYEEAVRMFFIAKEKVKEYEHDIHSTFVTFSQLEYFIFDAVYAGSPYPMALHTGMYVPTIKGQGTDQQISELMPKAETYEHIGTYAQTELGHGTFLRGLETTATYDKHTQEFVIHSPTLSSMKYWPGGLGKTCNHAVVMAQLIIDGTGYGLSPFICQLRELETHQPLPGIELGDINQKFGYNVVDNGYLKFDHYRIPRTNMLMRNAQVSPEGKFTSSAVPQTTYLTMTYVRMTLVQAAAINLSKAATIATRYSAVRHQTANSKGVEPQVLDYQTQQMKVIPAICTAYALFFNGFVVNRIYNDIMVAVQSGDTSRLPEMHSVTSGLKAYTTDVSCELMEVCRRSCGGHGYSLASGIPSLLATFAAACTYEGENTVMYLQCARSLIKFLGKAQSGEKLPVTLQFLSKTLTIPPKLKSAEKFDFDLYVSAFELNALSSILCVASELKSSQAHAGYEAAWNSNSYGLVEAAKVYSMYLTVKFFVESLSSKEWETRAKAVMTQVCEFYLVNCILDSFGSFLQNGVLSSHQIGGFKTRRIELLAELRPNAVTLVDAFDYPDRMLNSCLGRYDGNVYEALYEYAKSSSLNQHQVHPSFHKYIKPMRQALQSKL